MNIFIALAVFAGLILIGGAFMCLLLMLVGEGGRNE